MSAQDASNITRIRFESDDTLRVHHYVGNSLVGYRQTTQVFRDPSAWYHIVWTADTTSGTGADRLRFYVNGSRITQFASTTDPSQNADLFINSTNQHKISSELVGNYVDGYLADVYFIDGQALDPSSFGEFDDNGIWQPIAYTGSYGTNGFHLPFDDNSTAAALGTDTSGNGNTWSVNNISVGNTKTIQVGTPTYPSSFTTTGNKTSDQTALSYVYWSGTYTGAVTKIFRASDSSVFTTTINISGPTNDRYLWYSDDAISWTYIGNLASLSRPYTLSGHKYYATSEGSNSSTITVGEIPSNNDSLVDVPTNGTETDTGVGGEVRGNYCTLNPLQTTSGATLSNGNLDTVTTSTSWQPSVASIYQSSGKWYAECTITAFSGAGGQHIGIVGPAFNVAAGSYIGYNADSYGYRFEAYKYNNGTSTAYGASYGLNDVVGVAMDLDAGTLTFYKNGVSQGTAFTGLTGPKAFASSIGGTSGTYGVSWNFGQRPFAYTAPSGFKALCTANLPAPVVTKPSTVMDVKLYTGNGSTQTISGLGFSPDLVWIKARSAAYNHDLTDSVRGATKSLYTSLTQGEATDAGALTAFNSDGFSVGSTGTVNGNSVTFAAWCWDAGSSTVTNTQGSITTTVSVRANATAGFSAVTYTGTATNCTVGHGLGVAPELIILKNRDGTSNWAVWHKAFGTAGSSDYLYLNSTIAKGGDGAGSFWNSTVPTSTVFSLGNGSTTNTNNNKYVAYCFAPVSGYSSFGSYTGNGSADGPFVYTGFRPRWILVKSTGATGWAIIDAARNAYNLSTKQLFPHASDAELDNSTQYLVVDLLSNGFKLRTTSSASNTSSQSYVFAAFAESPFQYARAR